MSWTERLALAQRAAREAGELLRTKFGRHLQIRSKSVRSDLVTDADTQSEALIRRAIAQRFPGDAVLGEEEGLRGASSARWIIDPLDGTTNFAHGYPFFSVSIAFESDGLVAFGVVYDPTRDELFVAQRGEQSRCNGGSIAVSTRTELRDALLVTGFPPFAGKPPELRHFSEMMTRAQAIRRDGSAAHDLCYVAAGRFDGFWEADLHAWDIAAGALIVEQAGGRVSDFRGGALTLDGRRIVASAGAIHDAMIDALKDYD